MTENESPTTNQKPTIEEALYRLEKIVHTMEEGNLPLDSLLTLYEEGAALVKICQQRLEEAERKILLVTKSLDGSPQTKEISPPTSNPSSSLRTQKASDYPF
ncbi:MAG: exodeoxyribonuclease VII small subunit [Chthoniobacterales bacterium]|nr:exodeoxyribonuclease VII small subunit [Chthoniobacterales bacterium]MCX7713390.1 exodeoxyribonuclease VII small subunit [Chthoniobacterales bacterium]